MRATTTGRNHTDADRRDLALQYIVGAGIAV